MLLYYTQVVPIEIEVAPDSPTAIEYSSAKYFIKSFELTQ